MIDLGKRNLLGIGINAVDYESAVGKVIACARAGQRCATSALAVHGVITGVVNRDHRSRLNALDLTVPDGQPVRWALNWLHGTRLADRVYGPRLMFLICEEAARQGVGVFFFGSRQEVVDSLCDRMRALCPGLKIAGGQPSRFRRLTPVERGALVQQIAQSGAQIVFVGLGCPRQEVFAYEMSAHLRMPIIAVGAAFDYYAGLLNEPPGFIQAAGLQWLYRMVQEPRRLFWRYLSTNTRFVLLFLLQRLGIWKPELGSGEQPVQEMLYG